MVLLIVPINCKNFANLDSTSGASSPEEAPDLLHTKLCILPQINNETKFLWSHQRTGSYSCNIYTP
jgi:hypothetical protein